MLSYLMKLQSDVLEVGFTKGLRASGEKVVMDALITIEQMQERGQLTGGKLLKIDGPQSIAVAYLIAHKIAHLYGAIAIFDPKVGKPGFKTYIVVISHDPDYAIGTLVETEEPYIDRQSVKLVLCGPPQSGKSCLKEGLKWQIMGTVKAPYPYLITACPDGEPAGIQEVFHRDPNAAADIKHSYKSQHDLEYAEKTAQGIKSAGGLINIIDVGGKTSAENQIIMGECTHAVILAGGDYSQHFAEWEDFCKELNLPVIAKIHSDYAATEDRIDSESPLLTGSIHHLHRGEEVSDRPMIKALAKLVVDLTYNQG